MKRKGFAIPLVLIFASVLGILATFIIKRSRHYNRFNTVNLAQLQAHFVTRAAFQHAMLKVKLLNRELYDAVCLAQGRNPLFDFTQIKTISDPSSGINAYNPGPIYLYHQGDFTNNNLFTANFSQTGNIEKSWLNTFKSDINSGLKTGMDGNNLNTAMSLNQIPNEIRSLMKEPFTGQYDITDLNIVARDISDSSTANIVNNTAVVEISVSSTVTTARGDNWNHSMKKTVKVFRDNVN